MKTRKESLQQKKEVEDNHQDDDREKFWDNSDTVAQKKHWSMLEKGRKGPQEGRV